MIDVESDVYSYVATALRTSFSNITVSNEYNETYAKFPAVTIIEADNREYHPTATADGNPCVSVMYEINVFSDKGAGRKAQAKKILAVADEAFATLGFERTFSNQVPNFRDATIYRIVARYSGIVRDESSGNTTLYRVYTNQ